MRISDLRFSLVFAHRNLSGFYHLPNIKFTCYRILLTFTPRRGANTQCLLNSSIRLNFKRLNDTNNNLVRGRIDVLNSRRHSAGCGFQVWSA